MLANVIDENQVLEGGGLMYNPLAQRAEESFQSDKSRNP